MTSSLPDEDVPTTPPTIDPYAVLNLERSATEDEVKKAYRKAALKHHPDKATQENKAEAHTKFQEVAFAYAILSSSHRRARFDATGRADHNETDDEDAGFNWTDFYRAQFASVISAETLDGFKGRYQNSEEEQKDILASYEVHEGDMDKVYEEVMLSDPVEDEERFRAIIDAAIEKGEVAAHQAYTKETKAKRSKRVAHAKKEAEEAKELAKELGLEDKLALTGEKTKKRKRAANDGEAEEDGDEAEENGEEGVPAGLLAIFEQRQKDQEEKSEAFLNGLEERYADDSTKNKKRTKKNNAVTKSKPKSKAKVDSDDDDEDPKPKTKPKPKSKAKVVDSDDEDEGEDEDPKPKPKAKAKPKPKASKAKQAATTTRNKTKTKKKNNDQDGEEDYEEKTKMSSRRAPSKRVKKT